MEQEATRQQADSQEASKQEATSQEATSQEAQTQQATSISPYYVLRSIQSRSRARSEAWRGNQGDEDDYTLLFFTAGKGSVRIAGEELNASQGSCFVVGPGMALSIEPDRGDCSYYRLDFTLNEKQDGEEARNGSASRLLPDVPELACMPFAKALELVEDLYVRRYDTEELALFHRFVRFQELMLFLLHQNSPSETERETDSRRQGIERSIQHIHQHYQDLLTVEELAAIARIDRWKYTNLFKEATGQLPLQYLNELRINQAKKWLMRADDKLFDIAKNAGFSNEYYFNRRFKMSVGMSPGQYRRSHREQLRVVAPYLEDFMVALDIMPVVQYSHARWGKQDYLGLNEIPTFDEMNGDFESLSSYKPDLILLMDRYEHSQYSQCRRISSTCVLRELNGNWRTLLRTVADYVGRSERADEVIARYEDKAREARQTLSRRMKKETVAFLRISADHIHQYADTERGFAAAVLYDDLGLRPLPKTSRASTDSSGLTALTIEELAALEADHLFITFDKWHSQADGEERKLLRQPIWNELPAVRNNRVYEVDFLTWMNHGVISNGKKIDDILRAMA